MSKMKGSKSVLLRVSGVAIIAALAIWQFYVFVTFKDAAGVLDLQGGRAHLWWAIMLGVVAFIAGFLLLWGTLQYDRGSEMHITSPPSRNSA